MANSSPSTLSTPSLIPSLPEFASTSTTRFQALYSDFSRQKHSNPVSFHANVEWWRKALGVIVSCGLQEDGGKLLATKAGKRSPPAMSTGRLVLHANASLMDRLKIPKVGKPLALGTVLMELHNTKSFIPLSEFLTLKSSIYSTSSLPVLIASYVIGKPLWWALEQAGIVGEEGILGSSTRDRHKGTSWFDDYIVTSLVEKAAENIVEIQRSRMASPADALYSLEGFRKAFAPAIFGDEGATEEDRLHEQDARILLKYLERDRGLLLYDKDLIKFIETHAPDEARTITPVDRGILELKKAIHNLQAQVDSLHEKIDRCTKQASLALQQNRKPMALNFIRSRKQIQDLLNKRLGSLHTLEGTLITVEAAAGDVEIMKLYESSTATLKSILAHPSLNRDSIDQTMEALAEANADARDIDETIKVGADIAVGASASIDEAEIEDEWQALVQQMEAEGGQPEAEAQRKRLEEITLKVPDGVPEQETSDGDKAAVLAS